MVDKNFSFRFIAYQEEDKTFTAVCLDLDIVEEGHSTMEEARLSIDEAVRSHLEAIEKLGFPKELTNRPAPQEYWTKLDTMVTVKQQATPSKPFSFYNSDRYVTV